MSNLSSNYSSNSIISSFDTIVAVCLTFLTSHRVELSYLQSQLINTNTATNTNDISFQFYKQSQLCCNLKINNNIDNNNLKVATKVTLKHNNSTPTTTTSTIASIPTTSSTSATTISGSKLHSDIDLSVTMDDEEECGDNTNKIDTDFSEF